MSVPMSKMYRMYSELDITISTATLQDIHQ